MKKTRRKPATTPPLMDVGDRVRYLLEHIWQKNRSRMAQEVGFSHTAINDVASGRHAPGRRLLQAIAEHPKVNPQWLFSGEGAPLLEAGETAVGEWKLPILKMPLAGLSEDRQDLTSEEHWAVPPSEYRPSRYFVVAAHDWPVVRCRRETIAMRDLLLLDHDPSARELIGSRSEGCLCVVAPDPRNKSDLKIARVKENLDDDSNPIPSEVMVDTFEHGLRESELATRVIFDVDHRGKILGSRSYRIEERAMPPGERLRVVPQPPPEIMPISRVVAVCIRLVRREP